MKVISTIVLLLITAGLISQAGTSFQVCIPWENIIQQYVGGCPSPQTTLEFMICYPDNHTDFRSLSGVGSCNKTGSLQCQPRFMGPDISPGSWSRSVEDQAIQTITFNGVNYVKCVDYGAPRFSHSYHTCLR